MKTIFFKKILAPLDIEWSLPNICPHVTFKHFARHNSVTIMIPYETKLARVRNCPGHTGLVNTSGKSEE